MADSGISADQAIRDRGRERSALLHHSGVAPTGQTECSPTRMIDMVREPTEADRWNERRRHLINRPSLIRTNASSGPVDRMEVRWIAVGEAPDLAVT